MDPEAPRKQLDIQNEEAKDTTSQLTQKGTINSKNPFSQQYKTLSQIVIYSFLVLTGQSAATLLTRLYYSKGGKNKYIAALVQSAGFPILLPLLYIISKKNPISDKPNILSRAALYSFFGTFLAFDCMLYAIGLMYLPVSTFSLICATQLGFNAFFSYFINSQKITPLIVNSIFILTISTILLVLEPDSSGSTIKGKYVIGFVCTLCGAGGYALILSVEQYAYRKVLKRLTIKEILEVIFFESMVTTFVLLIGLFGSGEWRSLKKEIEGFELGGKYYVMILVLNALAWQVFAVGMVALILKVSSLFGNVISTFNVPVVPVLAVVFFGDKMSGIKVVSMLLAVWGFVSYVYQQYVDDVKSNVETDDPNRD